MTAEKLNEILTLMVRCDEKLRLQQSLNQIKDNLVSLANGPAQVQFQNGLASAKAEFAKGMNQLRQEIRPAEWSAIAELGGSEFFDPSIEGKVRDSIEHNAMTPAVARDFAQDLAERRQQYLQRVRSTLDGLTKLLSADTTEQHLSPAQAAFTIPWQIFDGQLSKFAEELEIIGRLLDHMSEASTGEHQPVQLESLSASTPTVGITTGLKILNLLAQTVTTFLVAWDKVQKLRGIKDQMEEAGFSGSAAEELNERITTTVEEVVEESVKLTLSQGVGDGARRNEIENGLRTDFRRLFGQIERGLTVEFRTDAEANLDERDTEDFKSISDIAPAIRFPPPSRNPVLLTDGQVLKGEIERKKSTTRKTSTEKVVTKRPVEEVKN